jgi:hypothetical protein
MVSYFFQYILFNCVILEMQTNQTLTKPKLINTKLTKSLLLGIGLFMLLGLCLGILILLIQRGES